MHNQLYSNWAEPTCQRPKKTLIGQLSTRSRAAHHGAGHQEEIALTMKRPLVPVTATPRGRVALSIAHGLAEEPLHHFASPMLCSFRLWSALPCPPVCSPSSATVIASRRRPSGGKVVPRRLLRLPLNTSPSRQPHHREKLCSPPPSSSVCLTVVRAPPAPPPL
jgi:hypothetical protein